MSTPDEVSVQPDLDLRVPPRRPPLRARAALFAVMAAGWLTRAALLGYTVVRALV